MKQCGKCKITKPLSEFNKREASKDKLQNYCRDCQKDYMGGGEYMLQRDYGISLDDKRRMIDEQNGVCFTCKQPFTSTTSTHVDHCHNSLKIRGILCSNCNTTLGLVKESTTTLHNMINYLEQHAQENAAPSVPTGFDPASKDNPELGSVLTTGAWQNNDDAHHHCGTISWEDANHRAQASSGDSVGCGGQEVGSFITSYDIQNNGLPCPEVIGFKPRGKRIPDKP